jgi:hypothetical protein
MGEVDIGDQLIGQYEPQFRSLKLWKNMFLSFLMIASGKSLMYVYSKHQTQGSLLT